MIINTSQGDVEISLDDNIKSVGIKLSGGADSAMLAYLLAVYKKEQRPDLRIVPMTNVCKVKPYNEMFARSVIDFITADIGVEFQEHLVIRNIDLEGFLDYHDKIIEMLYHTGLMDEHFMAITSYPPDGGMDMSGSEEISGLERTREIKPLREGRAHRPFYNLDKKGVAEIYDQFGLTDRLVPLTRSCEAHTHDFSHHCGTCWWCKERMWAFGRL
jgi:hypothetical protein